MTHPIELMPRVWLVGSGGAGFDLTDPLDCHVYLVFGDAGWALIDAGSGADSARIIANIEEAAERSKADLALPGHLLVTHGHADHSGGAGDLADAFPSLRVRAGREPAAWMVAADRLGISLDRGIASGVYPAGFEYRGCAQTTAIEAGELIDLGDREISVLQADGHAAGHLCFLLRERSAEAKAHSVLFSGDCVFVGGLVSIQNLHDVDVQSYARTLERLAGIDFHALLPGHHAVSLNDGTRHVRAAAREFVSGRVPGNA